MDEHRVGLKPILQRVWAPRGERPIAPVRPRYEWLYVYAFRHPRTGRNWWLLLPTVNVQTFNLALREFAKAHKLDATHRILLVLDQAGWHASAKVQRPIGLDLLFLPPYSPELQPAERLWRLSDEPLVNRTFATLAELQDRQAERCRELTKRPEVVGRHTGYWWWPNDR